MYMTRYLDRRIVKAHLIALLLIAAYTVAGVFFSSVVYPGALDGGTDADNLRTQTLVTGHFDKR